MKIYFKILSNFLFAIIFISLFIFFFTKEEFFKEKLPTTIPNDKKNSACQFHGVGQVNLDSINKIGKDMSNKVLVTHIDGNKNIGKTISGKYNIRGNHTATLPKKSYRLELKRAIPFMGMPADKKWNFLANYQDKSYLRNAAAMCAGQLTGMNSLPRNRFAELYINNNYLGLYNIFETIDITPNRINIGSKGQSSWLLEINYRQDKENKFITKNRVPYHISKSSSDISIENIKKSIDILEDTLKQCSSGKCPNDINNVINIESLLKYIFIQDLFKNVDAFLASTFLWREGDGPINYGPIWDFDIAAGNFKGLGAEDHKGFYINNAKFPLKENEHNLADPSLYVQWIFSDQKMLNRYLDIANEFSQNGIQELSSFIRKSDKNLKPHIKKDKSIWQKDTYKINNESNSALELELWLTRRLEWLLANYPNKSIKGH